MTMRERITAQLLSELADVERKARRIRARLRKAGHRGGLRAR